MEKYLQHLTDGIGQSLNNMAQHAGFVLSHLWIVIVKQELITGTLWTSVGVLCVIASLICLRICKHLLSKKMDSWDKNTLLTLMAILTIWLFVQGIGVFTMWLPHMLNPEYYAIRDSIQILDQVRK